MSKKIFLLLLTVVLALVGCMNNAALGLSYI